jgi:hypothetical protein
MAVARSLPLWSRTSSSSRASASISQRYRDPSGASRARTGQSPEPSTELWRRGMAKGFRVLSRRAGVLERPV